LVLSGFERKLAYIQKQDFIAVVVARGNLQSAKELFLKTAL